MKRFKTTFGIIGALWVGLASAAYSYEYVSEEGRFSIDVPEGWEVEDNMGVIQDLVAQPVIAGILPHPKGVSADDSIMMILLKDYDKLNRQLKNILNEDLTIDGLHKVAVKLLDEDGRDIVADTYLNESQVSVMNLDSAFVLTSKYPDNSLFILAGHFLKGKRVYNLGGGGDWDLYKVNEDNIIKTLNSFRALD
jgi:DNA topoisomerase VI subunit B